MAGHEKIMELMLEELKKTKGGEYTTTCQLAKKVLNADDPEIDWFFLHCQFLEKVKKSGIVLEHYDYGCDSQGNPIPTGLPYVLDYRIKHL